MSAWSYKRLMPKVLAAKQSLIDSRELTNLVGRDLGYVQSMLLSTHYHKDIANLPRTHINSYFIEKALQENYIRTCEEIKDSAQKGVSNLLSGILKKFEASNIKAILRTISVKIPLEEAMSFITPVGVMDEERCRSLLKSSESVSDVIENLLDLEYGSELKESLKDYEETRDLLFLETAIDRFVYSNMYKAAGKLRGLDKKIAKTLIGMEIDSINIKIILRAKNLGIDKNRIMSYILPSSEVISKEGLEAILESIDIKAALESLLSASALELKFAIDYKNMLADLLREYDASQTLSRLEIVLDKSLLKASLMMLKRHTPFFNVGLIIAFLNAKWFEVRNLIAIVRGIEDHLPPEDILKVLVIVD